MVKLIGTMLALAALAALGIWLLWGNTALTAHEISVSSPRLPGAFDGLRIAQVSDLHNAQFGPDNAGAPWSGGFPHRVICIMRSG